MQNSITAVKNNIQAIHDKMVAEYKTCDQVFAFVRYTDFSQPKDSRTTSLNFTQWVYHIEKQETYVILNANASKF